MVSIEILIDASAAILPAGASFPSAIYIWLCALAPPKTFSGKPLSTWQRTLRGKRRVRH
jgi:hypothetical protein